MTLRENIKNRLLKTELGIRVLHGTRILREKWCSLRYDDYSLIDHIYRQRFGRGINLANPKTYTEKLQWLKLFYRNPLMPVCSDKYMVRNYLNKLGYGVLLNELVGVYDSVNEIDFGALPNRFAAKANHGSSWNLICTDKSKLNVRMAKAHMEAWLKQDLSVFGREWNYKSIPRKVIIERFIDESPLIDYKFMCFNGKPLYMQINHDIDGKHYVDFYDINWKRMPFTYGRYRKSELVLDKPPMFEEMLRIATELSKPFPFVRVDLYNIEKTIYFGELTFFPGGGLLPLNPVENGCDEILGEKLELPSPNHSLELLKRLKGGGRA